MKHFSLVVISFWCYWWLNKKSSKEMKEPETNNILTKIYSQWDLKSLVFGKSIMSVTRESVFTNLSLFLSFSFC